MSGLIERLFESKPRTKRERGQSLVEMAIAAPILIFLLIGLFEVGWAIRSYVVLVNVNREITRFAVRPGYLDFADQTTVDASYGKVRNWVDTSLTGQLDMNFAETDGNATLIVSHLVADTGMPCDPNGKGDPIQDCECNKFDPGDAAYDPNYGFAIDDLIIHPDKPGMEYQAQRFGPASTSTGPRDTRLDYTQIVQELAAQNNVFNCQILKKGGIPSSNNAIITELFMDQPQLFGFPLISNPFTDPVPLYTHTSMRLVCGSRSTGSGDGNLACGVDTIGSVCDAFPFIVHEDTIDYGHDTKIDQKVDIFNGYSDFGPGDEFGWLAWNPDNSTGSSSAGYLQNELRYSTIALNDFTDARDFTDHTLSVDDYVASIGGVESTVESSANLLTALRNRKIRIPVWDTFSPGDQNSPDPNEQRDAYHIVGFAWVRIETSSDFEKMESDKTIYARYLGDAADDCPTSDMIAGNNPPTAGDDVVSTPENTPPEIIIDVRANDTDPDGDPLTVVAFDTSVSSPFRGEVEIWDGGLTIKYKPKHNDTGTYQFEYTITDGKGGLATATVTVTVY
ncbi:MAG: Ig-like domain-containing protein [Chloroflexota bacterium]